MTIPLLSQIRRLPSLTISLPRSVSTNLWQFGLTTAWQLRNFATFFPIQPVPTQKAAPPGQDRRRPEGPKTTLARIMFFRKKIDTKKPTPPVSGENRA
jgi:hypothetical protein